MRLRALILGLGLAISLSGARLVAQPPETTTSTNSPADLDKTEANITRVTGALLQAQHFSHHPLDPEIANRFMDRYLDSLDHYHSYFLQSDLDEFDHYRTNLDRLTLKGDTSPCRAIFTRFMQRVEQRYQYVTNLLATEKFEFNGTDRYVPDRHTLAAPKTMDDAKALWREELRFEYLQEKLQAPDVKYGGPVSLNTERNAVIRVNRDKTHPLAFDFLPKRLLDQGGSPIATADIVDSSNAVVTVPITPDEKLKKVDRKIFGTDGKELGKITIRQQTNDVSGATNGVAAAPDASAPKTNLYTGVIQLNQKNMAEVNKTLTNRYTRLLKNFKELDRDDVFEIYMTALTHAYDPHSDYMSTRQAENFAISMKLSLFGIGAILQAEDGYCKVAELTPEGPASKSGKIKPGDRIVAVAQADKEPVDVVGMKLPKVVEQIRGPKGTEVRLTIIPAASADSSARQVITLIRDEIKLVDQAAKAMLYEVPTPNGVKRLGLIDLPLFYGDMDDRKNADRTTTTHDVAKLLTRLKKEHVDGVILDLRRNGGGFLEEAISLTGLFITKGPVVQTKEPTGEIVTDSDPDPSVLYDGPLIVLTSRFSASASEILAGALQDYGRALIVGDKSTFGKGTVQNLQNLAPYLDHGRLMHAYDPGEIKMTIRKFYRAGGSSTQLKGVVPDIELPSVLSYWDVGERSLEYPMPWDEVPTADFEKLNRVKPYLTDLQRNSTQRLSSDKEFSYIREDIEQYKKTQADKSVSLNETERITEKKQNEAKAEERKKDRLARPKSNEKVYEITLKNVNSPELMPPVVKTNNVALLTPDPLELTDEMPTPADSKAPDPALEETKRILVDYVGALSKNQITANATSSVPVK